MRIERCTKESFSVIGKEGSTNDGEGFIKNLWDDANSHFNEVEALAKRDAEGRPAGIWGLMSDMSRSFLPWEDNFSKGLYLAGVEVRDDAVAPSGWVKWTVPSSEYIWVECGGYEGFTTGINYLKENGLELVGAACDFHCPVTDMDSVFFPVRRI